MSEITELQQLEKDVAELGDKIEAKRKRALEIMRGRVVTVRSHRYRVVAARIFFGGAGARIFFSGPVLKKDGTPHARHEESSALRQMDRIEPAD